MVCRRQFVPRFVSRTHPCGCAVAYLRAWPRALPPPPPPTDDTAGVGGIANWPSAHAHDFVAACCVLAASRHVWQPRHWLRACQGTAVMTCKCQPPLPQSRPGAAARGSSESHLPGFVCAARRPPEPPDPPDPPDQRDSAGGPPASLVRVLLAPIALLPRQDNEHVVPHLAQGILSTSLPTRAPGRASRAARADAAKPWASSTGSANQARSRSISLVKTAWHCRRASSSAGSMRWSGLVGISRTPWHAAIAHSARSPG